MIVFDLSDPTSFPHAISAYEMVESIRGDQGVTVFVGNKFDVGSTDPRTAAEFAQQHGCLFCQTSARTGEGITEMFQCAAELAARKVDKVQVSNVLVPQTERRSVCHC
jgi:50S ribosomal subunit-associated GTPase HflX